MLLLHTRGGTTSFLKVLKLKQWLISYNLDRKVHESDSWQLKIDQAVCLAGNTQLNFDLSNVSLKHFF